MSTTREMKAALDKLFTIPHNKEAKSFNEIKALAEDMVVIAKNLDSALAKDNQIIRDSNKQRFGTILTQLMTLSKSSEVLNDPKLKEAFLHIAEAAVKVLEQKTQVLYNANKLNKNEFMALKDQLKQVKAEVEEVQKIGFKK